MVHVHQSIKNFGKLLIEHDLISKGKTVYLNIHLNNQTLRISFSASLILYRDIHIMRDEFRIPKCKRHDNFLSLAQNFFSSIKKKKKLRINRMSLFCSVCLVSFCQFFCLWMRKIFEQKIRIKPVKALGRNHEKRSQKIVIEIMIIIKEYLDL